MTRPRKFQPGPVIREPMAVFALIESGEWLYWHRKPQHPRVLACMTLEVLRGAARKGIIRLAIPTAINLKGQVR